MSRQPLSEEWGAGERSGARPPPVAQGQTCPQRSNLAPGPGQAEVSGGHQPAASLCIGLSAESQLSCQPNPQTLPTYTTVTVISCVDISICNAEQLCVSGREEPYGDPSDFSQPWSLKWHKRDYDQIMFATGDFKHWMIVSRDDLIGNNDRKYYRNEPILVESSSEQCDPYYCEISIKSESSSCNLLIAARMYRRRGDTMDSSAWFSIR